MDLRHDLRELLRRHEPADAREAAFRERMEALLDAEDPFSRSGYVPGHFTASAFVLSPAQDEIVLIFHKKLGIWVQPGGHVDPGDASVLDAARREVKEEVGLDDLDLPRGAALFDIDVHPIPARKDEPSHEHFDLRFLFTAKTRLTEASDEVLGVRWVPLPELPVLATDESVRRAVRKL